MADRRGRLTPAELARQLAVRAFKRGFAAGVELVTSGVQRRCSVPEDLVHWRAGHERGRAAAEAEVWAYEQKLKTAAELGVEVPHA